MHLLRLLILPCALLAAGAAQAQFSDLLKNAVTNAATNAVTSAASRATTKAVNGAIDGTVDGVKNAGKERQAPAPGAAPSVSHATAPVAAAAARPSSAHYCPETEGTPLPALGERPPLYPRVLWPDEPKCTPRTFSDYTFDMARAQVKAFDKAGAPLCPECVGGRAHDSLPAFHLGDGIRRHDLSAAVLALKEGEPLKWQGHRLAGRIELVGEQPIGAFPCRQYRWTLATKEGDVVAERPGLYCKFPWRDQDVAWHQVI